MTDLAAEYLFTAHRPQQSVLDGTCCDRPAGTQIRSQDRHFHCLSCKAHDLNGKFYTRKEWEVRGDG